MATRNKLYKKARDSHHWRNYGTMLTHKISDLAYFLSKEQPSVNLALPPVGVHKTDEQPSQVTAV
ncbi:hypothetical protein QG37_04927 [Candidozyma auris]|nr:hypothetical protein QG37_04927 [[Candida] auris]